MVSRKLAITGTVAACAACCAPLVVPIVWPVLIAAGLVGTGGTGGGWLAGLSLDVILCGGIALGRTGRRCRLAAATKQTRAGAGSEPFRRGAMRP